MYIYRADTGVIYNVDVDSEFTYVPLYTNPSDFAQMGVSFLILPEPKPDLH
jgi:hypothetical protein